MSAQPNHSRAFGEPTGPSAPRPEQVMDESFAAVPDAVARARLTLVERLRGLGADDRSLTDVAIAVSEACTNAVVHAYPETAAAPSRLPLSSRRIASTSTWPTTASASGLGSTARALAWVCR